MLGITLSVLFLPLFMRLVVYGISPETFPLGSQPYIHLLLSRFVAGEDYAPLFEGRSIPLSLFHYLLGFFSSGNERVLEWMLILLPLLSGLLSIILFQRLLARFSFPTPVQFMTLISLILSPAFIYTFTVASPDSLSIIILLLGGVLFLSPSWLAALFGSGFMVLGSLFSLFHALLVLFFLFFYLLKQVSPSEKKRGLLTLIVVLLPTLFLPQPFFVPYRIFPFTINNLISDFGSVSGLSLFFIILLGIGAVYAWREKKQYGLLFLLCMLIAPMLIVHPPLLIYFAFASTLFVGCALARFKESVWHFRIVGRITLFVIILGLLFSSLSYANRMKDFPPSPDLVHGLDFLHDYSTADAVVLSVPEMGYFIEYFADRAAFIDEALPPPVFSQRRADAEIIFQSRNLDQTKSLLLEHSITHLVITREMKEGGVWNDPEQGLLFVLRDSETFKNVYVAPYLEIWEFIP